MITARPPILQALIELFSLDWISREPDPQVKRRLESAANLSSLEGYFTRLCPGIYTVPASVDGVHRLTPARGICSCRWAQCHPGARCKHLLAYSLIVCAWRAYREAEEVRLTPPPVPSRRRLPPLPALPAAKTLAERTRAIEARNRAARLALGEGGK